MLLGFGLVPCVWSQTVVADTQLGDSKLKGRVQIDRRSGVVFCSENSFELKCDLYRSVVRAQAKPHASQPAIVCVHGGAWRTGSRLSMLRHASVFAKAGYVVMSIDYRLAPRHPFPAQIHDCKYAVRWLKANAADLGVDPDRIGAFGYSAGGHLVGLLGTTDPDDGLEGQVPRELQPHDSSVRCVVAGGAPCEFSWIKEDATTLKYWLQATRRAKPKTYADASPLSYVDAGDVPFFFFHGQYDLIVPIDSSIEMHNALMAVGIDSEHDVALLAGHMAAFSMMGWAAKSVDFFDEHLKNPQNADESRAE